MAEPCVVCGRPFEPRAHNQVYCSAGCRREMKRRKARAARATRAMARRGRIAAGGYEVVRDALPVEEGGFRPGARFSRWEVDAMLAMRVLAVGTVLRDRMGRQFVVVEQRQRLELVMVGEE